MCHQPEPVKSAAVLPVTVPVADELIRRIDAAPPMRGGEDLAPELSESVWTSFDARVRDEVSHHPQGRGARPLAGLVENGRPPRPQVSVSIGSQASAGVGADTLLDFSAALTLDGESLTDDEWQDLLRSTEGLALIRGKWVEVDPTKLQQALDHWKIVEKSAPTDGLSFFEGNRRVPGRHIAGQPRGVKTFEAFQLSPSKGPHQFAKFPWQRDADQYFRW